jgi:hypothetical protein
VANDPELTAMADVSKALADLDDEVRGRVLRWAAERYGVALGKGAGGLSREVGAGTNHNDESEFAEVGDLVSAAQPITDAERALLVAYWLQERESQQVTGQRVNVQLKNLGHGVERINDVFAELLATSPHLVIQTKRSGTHARAKKQYKVTKAGIERVHEMLAASSGE